MPRAFDYFVIFAGMRTGSNFFERNLNAVPDLQCYGELFNPYFIAHDEETSFMGVSLAQREADPAALIKRIQQETPGLPGFRLFHDHDRRVRNEALANPRVGKIILTRNPLESFVSYQRALASNQWVLTDAPGQIATPPIEVDYAAFESFYEDQVRYLTEIRAALARAGQTAFTLRYEDLFDLDVLNGAIAYLGSDTRLKQADQSLKRQNPEPLDKKVANVAALKAGLAQLDPFGLDHVPPTASQRGPAVPSYIACANTPLLYLPIPGVAQDPVVDWMAALDGVSTSDLITGMRQKELRAWREAHPGARSFTVLHHPVARAAMAYEACMLGPAAETQSDLRHLLSTAYGVPPIRPGMRAEDQRRVLRQGFAPFLKFLKANLNAQTSYRIDPTWVGQMTALQGMAQVALPDRVLRAGRSLPDALVILARSVGRQAPDVPATYPSGVLPELYSGQIENAARSAYRQDYAAFGFVDWSKDL